MLQEDPEPPTVGDVLARKLADAGIRPTELARRAGVRLSAISALLSGHACVDDAADGLLAEHLGTETRFWQRVQANRLSWEQGRKEPQPDPALAKLRELLVKVARYDDERIDKATRQLVAAIEEYRTFAAGVRIKRTDKETGKETDAKVTTEVADMRRTLRNFANALERNKGPLEPRQRNSVARWYGDLTIRARILLAKHLNAPLGTALDDLVRTRKAVRAALAEAVKAPDKEPDLWRVLLAADVALVLRDVLGVKPTTVRHEPGSGASAKRAAFSRTLASVLAVLEGWDENAARYRQGDLNRLMMGAKRILEDLDSPVGKRRNRRKWRPRPHGRVTVCRCRKWGRFGGKIK